MTIKLTGLHEPCFFHLMKLILIALMFLSAVSANANQFEGVVQKIKTRTYLVDSRDQRKYLLSSTTPLIATYINKLSEADFVSIEAARNTTSETLSVRSINYVGLKNLIGTWLIEDIDMCLTFNSYTEFYISARTLTGCASFFDAEETYSYFVNPTTRNWAILIAGEYNSYVGDILITSTNHVEIKLYESKDGSILRVLNLRKTMQ